MTRRIPTRPTKVGAARNSHAETVRLMLETGCDIASEHGLRVTFELMKLEDIITKAGVARAAVYNHWRGREAYFHDLLLHIAREGGRLYYGLGSGPDADLLLADVRGPMFETSEGRRALAIELSRIASMKALGTMLQSPSYVNRFALYASLFTVADDDFREKLATALRENAREHITTLSNPHRTVADAFGCRLSDPVMDWERFAEQTHVYLTGVAYAAKADPEVWLGHRQGDPFGTGRERAWCPASRGLVGLQLGFISMIPDEEWTPERTAHGRGLIEQLAKLQPTEEWPRVRSDAHPS